MKIKHGLWIYKLGVLTIIYLLVINGCSNRGLTTVPHPHNLIDENDEIDSVNVYNFHFIDREQDSMLFVSFPRRIGLSEVVRDEYLFSSIKNDSIINKLSLLYNHGHSQVDTIKGFDTRLVIEFCLREEKNRKLTYSYINDSTWLMNDYLILKYEKNIISELKKILGVQNLTYRK